MNVLFWKIFKKEYKKRQDDIIYQRYKRSEMIEWLNSIKSKPLQLVKEEKTFRNTNNKDYQEELKILGLLP